MVKFVIGIGILCCWALTVLGQDNYEIQVYGSPTTLPGITMIELHSNFTAEGSKASQDGVRPTQHALHETIEITHGFNNWFELGTYIFTSTNPGYGFNWVGDHIRPRVRVPESWHWAVGASFSAEVGYQRSAYSGDTWTLELRPIIDKQWGKLYLAFNPTLGRALSGINTSQGFIFSPNLKFSYLITPKVAMGLEYYGTLGPLDNIPDAAQQQHQLVPAIDLYLSPDWEFNFGVCYGATRQTDRLIIKAIVGRRFGKANP